MCRCSDSAVRLIMVYLQNYDFDVAKNVLHSLSIKQPIGLAP